MTKRMKIVPGFLCDDFSLVTYASATETLSLRFNLRALNTFTGYGVAHSECGVARSGATCLWYGLAKLNAALLRINCGVAQQGMA